MSPGPAPINPADLVLVSPDPLVRGRAWAKFYAETKVKILDRIYRVAAWLDPDDAKSILNDAYLKAANSLMAEPELLSRYRPEVIVVLKAQILTTDHLRRKCTLKRGRKIQFTSLESSSPALSGTLTVGAHPPDPWLEVELRRRIDGLSSRLQILIGHAILGTPGVDAGEIAKLVAGPFGRQPSVGSVVTARRELRRKLEPFAKKIRKELAK